MILVSQEVSAMAAPGQKGRPPAGAELAEPAPRGRPRSTKAHAAVLRAAAELLLEHGLDAVSMDEVAGRAGVSKATIYRWWPTKETLALARPVHRVGRRRSCPDGHRLAPRGPH
jgi:DNA invertase Pin-like site-specific DNA recombinase